ncbi:MAG: sodC [Rhodospirillales bacterium]|jgi:Cu-Zn family superoxide dismutase|nr:sodC [Rhodospirillales bacterium]
MLKFLASAAAGLVLAGTAVSAEEVRIPMQAIDAGGIGAEIGTVTAQDGPDGLRLMPSISGLTPGPHGFHLHERPNCGPAERDGQMTAGLAAGGHFDPQKTKKHLGPTGEGHLGDLPLIEVGADGMASNDPLVAPRLKVADLHGHSLVVHAKGDNYSDDPEPLGGAGGRVACGVVP